MRTDKWGNSYQQRDKKSKHSYVKPTVIQGTFFHIEEDRDLMLQIQSPESLSKLGLGHNFWECFCDTLQAQQDSSPLLGVIVHCGQSGRLLFQSTPTA